MGYDSTMSVFADDNRILTVPSFQRNYSDANLTPGERNSYLKNWIIDVKIDGKLVRFVTVRTLSSFGEEVMCGRATVVWEALKLDDAIRSKRVSLKLSPPYSDAECIFIRSTS